MKKNTSRNFGYTVDFINRENYSDIFLSIFFSIHEHSNESDLRFRKHVNHVLEYLCSQQIRRKKPMVDNSIVISDLGIVPFFYKNCTAVGVESILLKCTHCIKKLKEKWNLYSPMVEYGFEPRGKSVEALLFYAVELKGITMRNYEQLSKNLNELFHSSQVQCICKAGKKREVRRMNKNNNN